MFVVAGVSGKTGSVVAETLLSLGKKVRVFVRGNAKGEAWSRKGADVSIGSLDDEQSLVRALAGANGFFTLLPEDLGAPDFHGHRSRMADALGKAVTRAGVPHTVFLSSTAAFLAEGNGPIKWLHRAEQALLETGNRATMIRACYFQENVLSALPAARNEGIYPNFFPSADFAFPTIATPDIGRLAARCLMAPPQKAEIIDLLGPAYSARDMAQELGRALRTVLRVVDIPAAAHVDAFTKAGMPRIAAESLAEMFACLASRKVAPCGDRTVSGSTELRETLTRCLGA